MRSAFDLPAEQRGPIENALNETFWRGHPLRFETRAGPGRRHRAEREGQKLAWSIADYLASLEKSVTGLLDERARPEPAACPGGSSIEHHARKPAGCVRPAFADLDRARASFAPKLQPREVGIITRVSTGIATVSGLPGVGFEELVAFPGGVFGIAFNVDEDDDGDEIGVVLLGDYWHLHAGDEVQRTGRVMDVAVGEGLLGRVIDPLGRPLDGEGPVIANATPADRAPGAADHGSRAGHRAVADRA